MRLGPNLSTTLTLPHFMAPMTSLSTSWMIFLRSPPGVWGTKMTDSGGAVDGLVLGGLDDVVTWLLDSDSFGFLLANQFCLLLIFLATLPRIP